MSDAGSAWCLTANIRERTPFGPGGEIEKAGSKHFRPGARVYVVGWYPGMCETAIVVGYHRGSRRMCRMALHVKYLEKLKAKVVYHPHVLKLMSSEPTFHSRKGTREEAEEMGHAILAWQRSLWSEKEGEQAR
jgi:hypothetical protein